MAAEIDLHIAFTEAQLDAAIRQVQAGCRSGLCDVSRTVIEAVAVRAKAEAIAKVLGVTISQLDWRCALFTRTSNDDAVLTYVRLSDHGCTVRRLRPGSGEASGILAVTIRNGRAW